MTHSDDQRARLKAASEALAEFRRNWEDRDDEPSDSDYDNLVASHSNVAQQLRKLIEQSRRGQKNSDQQSDTARRSREVLERALQELAGSVSFSQRYELRGEIGRGGMGAVIRVIDRKLGRPLAMKIIVGQADAERSGETPAVEPHRVARFLNEARITGQLEHPGIVPVHEVGVDSIGRVYFTMKLVEGRTLAEVFECQRRGDPEWSMPRVLTVIERVCEAMAFAHDRRVIHRDLKPANIMVGQFGEVYVMDWGVARRLGEADEAAEFTAEVDAELRKRVLRTGDGAAIGTPGYMSPEQARGDIANVGPTSDVYSIGAMLREVICQVPSIAVKQEANELTHEHTTSSGYMATRFKYPYADLTSICDKAMNMDATERYPSVSELLLALRSVRQADLREYITRRLAQDQQLAAFMNPTIALVAAFWWVLVLWIALEIALFIRGGESASHAGIALIVAAVCIPMSLVAIKGIALAGDRQIARRWPSHLVL